MKNILIRLYALLRLFGFDPRAFVYAWKTIPAYYNDLSVIKKQRGNDNSFALTTTHLQLKDKFATAGTMSGHYFHQDLLIARKIFENNPERHVDVGSRVDGFVAHVAVFREIEIIDIREMTSKITNIKFRQADLMELPTGMENYCDSISALHSIEHFGLGRYGDPIDYHGHLKALRNIGRMVKAGGTFYFSVPIGTQRIDFNAHRVFSIKYLLDHLLTTFDLVTFSYVNDKGDLSENIQLTEENIRTNLNCYWGCGIFQLKKRSQ